MSNPGQIAEKAAITHFLNCFVRETSRGVWIDALKSKVLRIDLKSQNSSLYVSTTYWSPTGKHEYKFPVSMHSLNGDVHYIGCWTCMSILIEELIPERGVWSGNGLDAAGELLHSILLSARNIEQFIKARANDTGTLYNPRIGFLESEQSLIFGHTFHPAPKSRMGFPEWRQHIYSPETKGEFRLCYFAAHRSIVQQCTAWHKQASDIVLEDLLAGLSVEDVHTFKRVWDHSMSSSYHLIPVHPIQREWLLGEAHVQRWMKSGKLVEIGTMGNPYKPTSSIRTLYHEDSEFMYKMSLRVKITNSMRVNKRSELDGAIEAAKLLNVIDQPLRARYPQFHMIRDAAYMTLGNDGKDESGFEMIIRHNPFHRDKDGLKAIVMAALTQDSIDGSAMLIGRIITSIVQKEKQSCTQVSVNWFRKYLSLSLMPMVWLYMEYGIGLEAHLQNSVLTLDDDGYPKAFYYRDSQGYYYARSMVGELEKLLPGIESSVNVFDDELVEERFGYYLMINHMFGLIQAFGSAGLAGERMLLLELQAALESLIPESRKNTGLLQRWLYSPSLRCKANLLTRLYDIDELESELEQAVYVSISNPLFEEIPNTNLIKRARLVTSRWREEINGSCYVHG
ncbi:N(2)-citryl-N(6)-acetyl-N(6)-hydroxylysine synthase [compost metagenome]